MKRMFIGGEYFYSPFIFFQKKKYDLQEEIVERFNVKYLNHTLGGYNSFLAIIDNLEFKTDDLILIPSFLCPTLLNPLNKRNINYIFYKINKDLQIDLEDIENKINLNIKAILVINYFGFQSNKVDKVLSLAKLKNIIVIEDIVQSFFSDFNIIGDYAFNSFRKFLPVDGSVILSKEKLYVRRKHLINWKYTVNRFSGQIKRYLHLNYGLLNPNYFLSNFSRSEEYYYKDEIYTFNKFNKYILSKFDVVNLTRRRRSNFLFLINKFNEKALIKKLDDNVVPLGFPILLDNRKDIRNKLIKKDIYCPIHWILPGEVDKKEFEESWYLSDRILTIPVSENVTDEHLSYLTSVMQKIL